MSINYYETKILSKNLGLIITEKSEYGGYLTSHIPRNIKINNNILLKN